MVAHVPGFSIDPADHHEPNPDLERAHARIRELEAERDAVLRHIPMDYLQRHDAAGATGPTSALNLAAAMKAYAEDRWKLIARLSAAEARCRKLEEALRESDCPRPCNGRPDDFTLGQCVDAGECGCYGALALLDQADGEEG